MPRSFWGDQAAGCLFFAQSTKRIGFALRGEGALEPGTYGTFGGAIDAAETPIDAVLREIEEEIGDFLFVTELIPLYVFRSDTFRYHNFLAIVPNEFDLDENAPSADENDAIEWVVFRHWPQPLHFGAQALLRNKHALQTIRNIINRN